MVIVPGNGGGGPVRDANWYGWLEEELLARGVTVEIGDMPDPVYAREEIWVPFIVDTLAGGEAKVQDTVFVGHSSGAAAVTCGDASKVSMHTGCSHSMTHSTTAPDLTNIGGRFDLLPLFLST